MRAARMACTVGGIWIDSTSSPADSSPLAEEGPGLHEGAHALLEKQRIAFRPLDQDPLERLETRLRSQELDEQAARALEWERVDAELTVVGLARPSMLILGAVARDEEQRGGGQALHEAVEPRLRLRVDPVEVLEEQHERLLPGSAGGADA